MTHPALNPSAVAVITGGASGIGLAAAVRFAGMGLRVCIADVDTERLDRAAASVADSGSDAVMTHQTDVSRREEVVGLQSAVLGRFGAGSTS